MKLALLAISVLLAATAGAEPMMQERVRPPDPPHESQPARPMTESRTAPTDSPNSPSTRKQTLPPAAGEIDEPVDASAPRFRLESAVTEKEPSRFARRLSELVGIDIRFSFSEARTLTLEAKEWTAVEALNRVAKQLQGSWTVEFTLSPVSSAAKGARSATKSLLPLGKVSLGAPHLTLAKALRGTAERAGCRVMVPSDMPFMRLRFSFQETPVEQAMADLAGKVRFTAKPCVVFELPESANLRAELAQTERESERVTIKGDVSAYLTESYGRDPGHDEFPWDNIDLDDLSISLAARLDITPEMAGDLLTEVRGEAFALRSVPQPGEEN